MITIYISRFSQKFHGNKITVVQSFSAFGSEKQKPPTSVVNRLSDHKGAAIQATYMYLWLLALMKNNNCDAIDNRNICLSIHRG